MRRYRDLGAQRSDKVCVRQGFSSCPRDAHGSYDSGATRFMARAMGLAPVAWRPAGSRLRLFRRAVSFGCVAAAMASCWRTGREGASSTGPEVRICPAVVHRVSVATWGVTPGVSACMLARRNGHMEGNGERSLTATKALRALAAAMAKDWTDAREVRCDDAVAGMVAPR